MGSKVELEPGKWLLRVYAGREGGRSVQKNRVFRGTKRQAERALRSFQVEVDQRRAPKAIAGGTVGELLEAYYQQHAWKSTGAKRKCREDLDLYLLPHLGPIRLVRFDEKAIELLYRGLRTSGDDCLAARGKPLADSTIRRLDKTLRAALNWGVKRKRIGWNPATNVEVPPEPPTKIIVPEPEEIPVILRGAMPDEFATFVRVALATGRRREDVLGLRLVDVKGDEGALVFDERVVLQKKDSVLTANRRTILAALLDEPAVDPKGGAAKLLAGRTGHQTVPALTRGLCDLERQGLVARQTRGRRTYRIEITRQGQLALRTADTKEKASGMLIEALDKNKRAARVGVDQETMNAVLAHIDAMRQRANVFDTLLRRDAFVFSDHPQGLEPWRPDSTSRKFATLMDAVGMPYTLHSLRHFHITELLTGGMDVETVAQRVGDDPRTIYKVYSHFRKSADSRATAIMASILDAKPTLQVVQ